MLRLADNLRKYAEYLRRQSEKVGESHAKRVCREDVHEFEVLKPACIFTRVHAARYQQLHDDLKKSEPFQPLFLGDYSPVDSKRRYDFKKEIAVPVKCVLYTYSGAREHYTFIWRIPETMSETDLLLKNASVQRQIEGDLPVYHSRCMRREFIRSFGTVTHAKPAVLREHRAKCQSFYGKSGFACFRHD